MGNHLTVDELKTHPLFEITDEQQRQLDQIPENQRDQVVLKQLQNVCAASKKSLYRDTATLEWNEETLVNANKHAMWYLLLEKPSPPDALQKMTKYIDNIKVLRPYEPCKEPLLLFFHPSAPSPMKTLVKDLIALLEKLKEDTLFNYIKIREQVLAVPQWSCLSTWLQTFTEISHKRSKINQVICELILSFLKQPISEITHKALKSILQFLSATDDNISQDTMKCLYYILVPETMPPHAPPQQKELLKKHIALLRAFVQPKATKETKQAYKVMWDTLLQQQIMPTNCANFLRCVLTVSQNKLLLSSSPTREYNPPTLQHYEVKHNTHNQQLTTAWLKRKDNMQKSLSRLKYHTSYTEPICVATLNLDRNIQEYFQVSEDFKQKHPNLSFLFVFFHKSPHLSIEKYYQVAIKNTPLQPIVDKVKQQLQDVHTYFQKISYGDFEASAVSKGLKYIKDTSSTETWTVILSLCSTSADSNRLDINTIVPLSICCGEDRYLEYMGNISSHFLTMMEQKFHTRLQTSTISQMKQAFDTWRWILKELKLAGPCSIILWFTLISLGQYDKRHNKVPYLALINASSSGDVQYIPGCKCYTYGGVLANFVPLRSPQAYTYNNLVTLDLAEFKDIKIINPLDCDTVTEGFSFLFLTPETILDLQKRRIRF